MNIKVNAVTVRKEKRTFAGIGKKQYEFDLQKEKDIYSYMQGMRVKKPKKLEEKLKFDSYCEWKKYVQNKYNGYDSKKLLGFGRYLKQGIRNVKPVREYWNFLIPVLITVGFAQVFEIILETKSVFTDVSFLVGLIKYVPVMSVAMVLVFFFSKKLTNCILTNMFDNNTKENMYTDYKEIIDEILEQKLKQEKKENKKKKMRKK